VLLLRKRKYLYLGVFIVTFNLVTLNNHFDRCLRTFTPHGQLISFNFFLLFLLLFSIYNLFAIIVCSLLQKTPPKKLRRTKKRRNAATYLSFFILSCFYHFQYLRYLSAKGVERLSKQKIGQDKGTRWTHKIENIRATDKPTTA